tara:strand:+ start:553 stop:834 length:282 start_codon:yes stop_codon:yes gene_type:complete
MTLDHNAIYKAYPTVRTIDDDEGAFDIDGNSVTLEQSKVDSARIELDKEIYKDKRQQEYPHWSTQLDYIYHNGVEKWKTDMVDPIKKKYPKPE